MISCLKKRFWFFVILFSSASFGFAQPTFVEVGRTPYDRQMARIEPMFTSPSAGAEGLSFSLVNEWMTELRAMPYRYSREWKTPIEVEAARMADCKGKAVALYDRMQLNGATNLRLVIGKRRVTDSLTHAWLEWDTEFGTILLDPTFNWAATIKFQDARSYVAFYGYEGGHKYRAGNFLLAGESTRARNPVAPAHGVITRPTRLCSRMRPSPLLFDETSIASGSFNLRSGF